MLDPSGAIIARFSKDFAHSFLRSTWHLQGADGNETGIAKERNLVAAVFRQGVVERLWSIIDRFRLKVTDAALQDVGIPTRF